MGMARGGAGKEEGKQRGKQVLMEQEKAQVRPGKSQTSLWKEPGLLWQGQAWGQVQARDSKKESRKVSSQPTFSLSRSLVYMRLTLLPSQS